MDDLLDFLDTWWEGFKRLLATAVVVAVVVAFLWVLIKFPIVVLPLVVLVLLPLAIGGKVKGEW